MTDEYEPTEESLDTHAVPEWYHDAKLGIFIHWGVYSVPAWAPTEMDINEALEDGFTDSPYAEWYPYFMHEDGSHTKAYHEETYGSDVEYADFIEQWAADQWDPEEWASFFADVGAGYVVLTGEHHDGFPLWDTHYTSYDAASMGPGRDLVGELSEAVREEGLRFAASYHANFNYYQPGFEGRFGHPDFEGGHVRDEDAGPGHEYVDFMNAKHRELIRKYDPDLLWFDVPKDDGDHLEARRLIADFYNRAEEAGREVVVNDRAATDVDGDFSTPEYETYEEIRERKWETCRGIGLSFGYNAAEGPEHHLDGAELVELLVDVVSKNGNLLINVGPRADGTIPDLQREPLAELGRWLNVHGEAIFGTTYWVTAEDPETEGVRYTWRDGTLYAIVLESPEVELTLNLGSDVAPVDVSSVSLLGEGDLDHEVADGRLRVQLPEDASTDPAVAIRIEGLVDPRS